MLERILKNLDRGIIGPREAWGMCVDCILQGKGTLEELRTLLAGNDPDGLLPMVEASFDALKYDRVG